VQSFVVKQSAVPSIVVLTVRPTVWLSEAERTSLQHFSPDRKKPVPSQVMTIIFIYTCCSVHISGCRGAWKTTLLNQIGMKLLEDNKTVWHFVNSKNLSFESVYDDIARAVESGEELYILVDETQSNHDASAFTLLVQNPNPNSHVTTIGAGIAPEPSSSYHFVERYQPESLLLLTDGSLEEHGVDEFFTFGCEGKNKQQMLLLLKYIRWYVGGHVYPLVWLAEKLKARILEGQSAMQVKKLLDSYDFRNEKSFKQMVDRIVPTSYTDLRPLLHKHEIQTE
jgi:hypothetical protein